MYIIYTLMNTFKYVIYKLKIKYKKIFIKDGRKNY